ncbi:hypothetical protein [Xenorhabdus yunnanensis]|uniref:hypothetical protein n=1 Tax=Xenorhabdus yunnanensis TaxID=3025878 RepID=UPI00359C82ED
MYDKFTNKHEKEMATTPYTRNQLIKSRSIIITGKINQQLAAKYPFYDPPTIRWCSRDVPDMKIEAKEILKTRNQINRLSSKSTY